MPDTQISTNNNANQYVTPEPSTRHEDEKREAPEQPMKPLLTCFSIKNAIGICQAFS